MLIALLAVLGVDLIVLVGLLAVVVSRKRWVMRQPGAFRGAIRVAGGEIDGLLAKWGRGYGRRVGVIRVTAGGATVEVAAKAEDIELLLGPYRTPAETKARSGGL